MTLYDKHRDFIVQSESPFNGNPPLSVLIQQFITPVEWFFTRNHGNIPVVDPANYCLTVDGLVEKPLRLTLDELKQDFEHAGLMATLQCAGNRRDELMEVAPIPNELPWSAGAISNATWGGARLRDVLEKAGVQADAAHVVFTGLDDVTRQGQTFGFGGSIPLDKALSSDTLLAYEMNGKPLTQAHGYPVRSLVPGYIGARSVKWLTRITVQKEPSGNYFQQHAYKVFPPDVNWENVNWDEGVMLGENAVNSVICYPAEGTVLKAGRNRIAGYAVGGAHPVAAVEVSIDDGHTWQSANLMTSRAYPWAWWLWGVVVELPPGDIELIARAVDAAGESQPRDIENLWNLKGYANNAWHRVNVKSV